jgi:FAD/FMN-containing dehydrogenase
MAAMSGAWLRESCGPLPRERSASPDHRVGPASLSDIEAYFDRRAKIITQGERCRSGRAPGPDHISISSNVTVLIEKTLHRLGEQLCGRLSLPGDDRYTAATAIWAKPVGRMPRAVAHCRTPEDVQSAIRAARNCDLPLSVRGGGHDWAGRALCAGLVIDLSGMNGVAIDGAVGMAGFTLGGGYGALIGRFGLALDNLIAAEVVLADGRLVVAKADSEEELFWALRGGGGNFGVITTMHHRLHDLPSVRSGMLIYPFSEARAVLAGGAVAASAPEDLTVQLGCVFGPNGAPVVMVVPTWCGRPEEGEARVAPFLKLGTLLAGGVDVSSYGTSLTAFDAYIVNGQRALMETCWLPALDSSSIGVFIEAMESAVSPGCALFTHEFRGAASRVPAGATAFGLRRDHVLVEILAVFADRSDKLEEHRHRQWARATLEAFDAMALPGGYPNLLAEGDAHRAMKSYGPNAEALIKAKRHYDPDNVFRSAIPLPVGQGKAARA